MRDQTKSVRSDTVTCGRDWRSLAYTCIVNERSGSVTLVFLVLFVKRSGNLHWLEVQSPARCSDKDTKNQRTISQW